MRHSFIYYKTIKAKFATPHDYWVSETWVENQRFRRPIYASMCSIYETHCSIFETVGVTVLLQFWHGKAPVEQTGASP